MFWPQVDTEIRCAIEKGFLRASGDLTTGAAHFVVEPPPVHGRTIATGHFGRRHHSTANLNDCSGRIKHVALIANIATISKKELSRNSR